MSFALWCAVSAALVGALAAPLAALSLPAVLPLSARLAPRARALFLEVLVALPMLATVTLCAAVLWPAIAGPDHCAHHGGHHPHVCPAHSAGLPSLALAIVASLAFARLAVGLAFAMIKLARARRVERELSAAARPAGKGIEVLPLPSPVAFVLGLFRPRLFVSEGLIARESAADVRVVLEHERAHARSLHPLREALASFLLAFHAPFAAEWLRRRLHSAYEAVADETAARAVGDRLRVADAIVGAARTAPLLTSAFGGGDLDVRVDDLLAPRTIGERSSRPIAVALLAIAIAAVALGASEIHHGLETLLGLF